MHMSHKWNPYVPLFVEIEAQACEDEGEERHEDSDGHWTTVGGAVGFRVRKRHILSHVHTWMETIHQYSHQYILLSCENSNLGVSFLSIYLSILQDLKVDTIIYGLSRSSRSTKIPLYSRKVHGTLKISLFFLRDSDLYVFSTDKHLEHTCIME